MKFIKLTIFALLASLMSTGASANWFTDLFKDTHTQTKYPIVLVHGLYGFDNLLGMDYFYQVPQELRRSGAQVFVAQVAAAASSETRGEQLARQVEAILASTGAHKVNLIGHSQGGPTARYVASVYPQYVASVTSVGGVNWGSKTADAIEGVTDQSSFAAGAVATMGNALADLIDYMSGGDYHQDIMAALHALTTPETVAFNAKYPEGMPSHYCGAGQELGSNGVRYFSWGGNGQMTTGIDPTDWLLVGTSIAFQGEKNDGLVASCSSHLGRVIRDDYPNMNHLDEVNLIAGMRSALSANPITLFRNQANRLKNMNL